MPNARRNPPPGATPPAPPSAPPADTNTPTVDEVRGFLAYVESERATPEGAGFFLGRYQLAALCRYFIDSQEPSPTSERTPNWFICPQCQLTKFGTANPQCFATGEPQILECHGLASDGPPFGCGWRGSWDDVRDGRIRSLETERDNLRAALTSILQLHPVNGVQAAILLAQSALSKASPQQVTQAPAAGKEATRGDSRTRESSRARQAERRRMAKTKIKRDRHSLYVRTNGNIYRPVESTWSGVGCADHMASGGKSLHGEGDQVTVRCVPQSNYCRVKAGDSEEWWHFHGWYATGDGIRKSEELWQPRTTE